MKQYFYLDQSNRQFGPMDLESLKKANITPRTLVWCEGMSNWTPAMGVPEVVAAFRPASAPTPPPPPVAPAAPPKTAPAPAPAATPTVSKPDKTQEFVMAVLIAGGLFLVFRYIAPWIACAMSLAPLYVCMALAVVSLLAIYGLMSKSPKKLMRNTLLLLTVAAGCAASFWIFDMVGDRSYYKDYIVKEYGEWRGECTFYVYDEFCNQEYSGSMYKIYDGFWVSEDGEHTITKHGFGKYEYDDD